METCKKYSENTCCIARTYGHIATLADGRNVVCWHIKTTTWKWWNKTKTTRMLWTAISIELNDKYVGLVVYNIKLSISNRISFPLHQSFERYCQPNRMERCYGYSLRITWSDFADSTQCRKNTIMMCNCKSNKIIKCNNHWKIVP